MNIIDSLKDTGKAYMVNFDSSYVAISDAGYLNWYDKKNGNELDGVEFEYIMINNWQPYHEVKEIRPEKEGELWETPNGDIFCVVKTHRLYLTDVETSTMWDIGIFKKDWTRLFPLVEDKNMERIEIENVKWRKGDNHISYPYIEIHEGSDYGIFHDVREDKNRAMKMILEIPKD